MLQASRYTQTDARSRIAAPKLKLYIVLMLMCLGSSSSPAEEGLALKRLFKSSPSFVKIVIETDKPRVVKCAVYDAQDNPLRVETQLITPPLDEILINTGDRTGDVANAKCWNMEEE